MRFKGLGGLGGPLVLVLFSACASQPWSGPARELEAPWSTYSAWDAGSFTVLATSFEGAGQVRSTVEDVLESLAEAGIDTGTGVVLAVDERDAPLLADPVELWSRLDTWHAQATGQTSPGAALLPATDAGPAVLRLGMTSGIPTRSSGLELPLEGADWAAIVPTDRAMAAVAYQLYYTAIRRNGRIDMDFERSYTFLPVTLKRQRREFGVHARARLCETILAARGPQDGPGGSAGACPDPKPDERIDHFLARLSVGRIVTRSGVYVLE